MSEKSEGELPEIIAEVDSSQSGLASSPRISKSYIPAPYKNNPAVWPAWRFHLLATGTACAIICCILVMGMHWLPSIIQTGAGFLIGFIVVGGTKCLPGIIANDVDDDGMSGVALREKRVTARWTILLANLDLVFFSIIVMSLTHRIPEWSWEKQLSVSAIMFLILQAHKTTKSHTKLALKSARVLLPSGDASVLVVFLGYWSIESFIILIKKKYDDAISSFGPLKKPLCRV